MLKRYFSGLRKLSYLGIGTSLTSLKVLAFGGTLPFTIGMNALSTEIKGPLAYSVCLAATVVAALDAYHHRGEMGAVGKTMAGVVVVGGLAMGAGPLLSIIPGVTGMPI